MHDIGPLEVSKAIIFYTHCGIVLAGAALPSGEQSRRYRSLTIQHIFNNT